MLAIGVTLRKWTLYLLLCSIPTCGLAHLTNETATVPASTATASSSSAHSLLAASSSRQSSVLPYADSTCPFRTINHITHTLPQQCLRTGWSASGPTVAVGEVSEGVDRPTVDVMASAAKQGVVEIQEAAHEGTPLATSIQTEETESAAFTSASDATSTQLEAELETDSPLDNANFLSFEEWKNKNLVRAGQSPENVGQARAASADQRNRRRPVNVNALDSLGEESEIEIDFSGFGNPLEGESNPSSASLEKQHMVEATGTNGEDKAAPSSWALSKDAGKTCKERFNYASFDCAATVLKTNPKAKSVSSILVENKDSYMLNECSAQNKFIIVELCDDILVDTVVLANYEFFSSMFRHFRISVSDRYPVKMDRWRELGTFEARNSRDLQPFLIKEPQIWARYLRLEFLTRYGNEFYCPMSLLRVHGTTMMEQFRREEEQARGDEDFAEPIEEAGGDPIQTADPPSGNIGAAPTEQNSIRARKDTSTSETEASVGNATKTSERTESFDQAGEVTSQSTSSGRNETAPPEASTSSFAEPNRKAASASEHVSETSKAAATAKTDEATGSELAHSSTKGAASTVSVANTSLPPRKPSADGRADSLASNPTHAKISNETTSISSGASSARSVSNSTSNSSASQAQGRSLSQTQPTPPTPTTQESFFKSIHKRLQSLEANSTLSLQYIEEQSRILRDAFIKVEKKQLQKTEKFLEYMNNTVIQELKSYRNMYEQLWQSTILELEGMKERQKTEMGEIGTRLSMVAEELVWQKRMAVVQSTLLLLCLGLVLFVRSGTLGSPSDVPFAQQLGNKYNSFFDSPPPEVKKTRGIRRRRTLRNIWKSDTSIALSDRSGHVSDGVNIPSDAETDGRRSPVQIAYSLPTPRTPGASFEVEKDLSLSSEQFTRVLPEHDSRHLTPAEESPQDQANRIQVLETQSGPATPRGSRDDRPSWKEVDRAVELLKAEETGRSPQLEREMSKAPRKRRSPLRRAESYDEVASDSPTDEGAAGLFVAG